MATQTAEAIALLKAWGHDVDSVDSVDDRGVLVRLKSDPEASTRVWFDTDQQRIDLQKALEADA